MTYSPQYITKCDHKLPFNVAADRIPKNFFGTPGETLESALSTGKLFQIDHSDFPTGLIYGTPQRYQASPTALFYLSSSKKLKPLAIKLEKNEDALVVTATDKAAWTLAKIIFNWADWHIVAADHFLEKVIFNFVMTHICIYINFIC